MPTTREEFESIFPFVRETVLAHAKKYGLPSKELEWFERSLNYNCLGGKYNRGMSVPDTAAILMGDAALSGEEYKMTAMLGWLTELLQAFFLVSDDIMDSSVTRRGQPCWFRNREVGMVAINDAFLLEMGIYMTLRQHFRAHPAYLDVVELFQETTFQTECGQLCDLLTAPDDETASLDRFSPEKWSFIVVYKTAWYSFYLPVALALHYLRLATPANLAQCERILIPLGEYFQAQDDYLDAFGSPEQIGKVGTDIQDNKCSWLANQALRRATPAQRKVLDDNYGRKDAANEAAVKALWRELQLDRIYHEFEEERVGALRKMIDEVDESEGLKKEIFDAFLKKIYKRSK